MTGIVAGNFDVIHSGYVQMFNDMNKHVQEIYVLLHMDPSLDRPDEKFAGSKAYQENKNNI